MFTRILVPLDGSARAESALPVAAAIARKRQGTVILVSVQTLHAAYSLWGMPPISADVIEAEQTQCAEYLAQVAGSSALVGVATETRVLAGAPAAAILDAVDDARANLVVMTSHGRTGLTRWVLGSVARQVAYHSPVAVLVLRDHGPTLASALADARYEPQLLIALDGSPLAEAAVDPALDLATALAPRAAVHLALVLSPHDALVACVPQAALVEQADSYLRHVAERIESQYKSVAVTQCVNEDFDAAEPLIRCAEEGDDTDGLTPIRPSDIVVMATHGRSEVAAWAMGSVTERVLHETKRPILIVRAPASADSTRAFMNVGAASSSAHA